MKLINDKKFWSSIDKSLEGKGRQLISLVNLTFILDEHLKDLPKKKTANSIAWVNPKKSIEFVEGWLEGYKLCLKDCEDE